MLSPKAIITESLAPAIVVTAIALLINGLNARFSMAATRVRELNRELRVPSEPRRINNIESQINLFLLRARMMRNAMFLLFGSLGMMIFTAFAIALSKLDYVDWVMLPSWTFLGGLIMMLLAIALEAYETVLNLRTLSLDVQHSLSTAYERAQSQSTDVESGKP